MHGGNNSRRGHALPVQRRGRGEGNSTKCLSGEVNTGSGLSYVLYARVSWEVHIGMSFFFFFFFIYTGRCNGTVY